MTAYFAPDTNFFLQCRPAEDLPWGEFTEATSIVLVVVKEVQRELDRHKNGGNARRARRARQISSQLRGAIAGAEVDLASADRSISIRLAPRLDPGRTKPSELDLTIADERIVEEVFACRTHFESDLVLLTNDMAPLQMALELGLAAKAIPDTWLLPPEPNELEKQVRQLMREVELLKGVGPSMRLVAEQDEHEVAEFAGEYFVYPELSHEFIQHAIEAITAVYPLTDTHGIADVPPISLHQYRVDYNGWRSSLSAKLQRLSTILNSCDEPVLGHMVITNVGVASAEHLLVDLRAKGSIHLVDKRRQDRLAYGLRIFPTPPMLKNDASAFDFYPEYLTPIEHAPEVGLRPAARDFVWIYQGEGVVSGQCQGECEDFRHGLQPHTKRVFLRPHPDLTGDARGAIDVIISAKNMPVPIEMTLPVRLSRLPGDTEQKAREILRRELDVNL